MKGSDQIDLGKNGLADIAKGTSEISITIKIQAEVEKIWLNFDTDNNGVLDQ